MRSQSGTGNIAMTDKYVVEIKAWSRTHRQGVWVKLRQCESRETAEKYATTFKKKAETRIVEEEYV
jgi:hypothetical protein